LSTIMVTSGCKVELNPHFIQLDSMSINSDLETFHHEWSWDSNVLFPSYHTEELEDTINVKTICPS
jgi:hypothetical protein